MDIFFIQIRTVINERQVHIRTSLLPEMLRLPFYRPCRIKKYVTFHCPCSSKKITPKGLFDENTRCIFVYKFADINAESNRVPSDDIKSRV